jgi:hypothetical protein
MAELADLLQPADLYLRTQGVLGDGKELQGHDSPIASPGFPDLAKASLAQKASKAIARERFHAGCERHGRVHSEDPPSDPANDEVAGLALGLYVSGKAKSKREAEE